MSSLPSEVLQDVLRPLDRWTLDNVQFSSRRFLQLIIEYMSDVCLRQIHLASFHAPTDNTDKSSYVVRIHDSPAYSYDDAPAPQVTNHHRDTGRMFAEFVQALRSSRVTMLSLNGKYAKRVLENYVGILCFSVVTGWGGLLWGWWQ